MEAIVALAHGYRMLVLADEAHGTHFYFGDGFPRAAMHCGADMSAVSMHKTGGSLTQSSILLVGDNPPEEHVRNIINLTRTTSASYLLMASLDLARRYLATEGRAGLATTLARAKQTRDRINAIGGYHAFGDDIIDYDKVFDFDHSKLSVHTLGIGLAGIEVYSLLRDRYGIQLEFGDTGNILALPTLGDTDEDADRLVNALRDLKECYGRSTPSKFSYEYIEPTPVISPREAFYARKVGMPITECVGRICGEAVMCYPPGIPIIIPGELITREVADYITYAAEKGCSVIGLSEGNTLQVLDL